MTDTTQKACAAGFNFCFWAKLIVAIPALPAVAYMAITPFDTNEGKAIASAAAVTGAILLAIWIDRIPALTKKVVQK